MQLCIWSVYDRKSYENPVEMADEEWYPHLLGNI